VRELEGRLLAASTTSTATQTPNDPSTEVLAPPMTSKTSHLATTTWRVIGGHRGIVETEGVALEIEQRKKTQDGTTSTAANEARECRIDKSLDELIAADKRTGRWRPATSPFGSAVGVQQQLTSTTSPFGRAAGEHQQPSPPTTSFEMYANELHHIIQNQANPRADFGDPVSNHDFELIDDDRDGGDSARDYDVEDTRTAKKGKGHGKGKGKGRGSGKGKDIQNVAQAMAKGKSNGKGKDILTKSIDRFVDESIMTEQQLASHVCLCIARESLVLAALASAHGQNYNNIFNHSKKSNDGRFSKWVSQLPGVDIALVNGSFRPWSRVTSRTKAKDLAQW